MTTIKVLKRGSLSLFGKAIKQAETILKDADKIVSAYQLKEDPVKFAADVLDFHPFPYQKDLLYDPSKRICACMGRQTGKSTTMAAKAIHFASTRKKKTILIVSATLRQSMLMFEKIIGFIDSSELLSALEYRTRTKVVFSKRYFEQNALIQAARFEISLEGATLYCRMETCRSCAMSIVGAGIK